MRWPQEAFGGARLHLAWRSEAISWNLFPTPKPHCPQSPELPKPPSQLPFNYCSPTVLFLKPSFLKLSSSPLQPEPCLAQLNAALCREFPYGLPDEVSGVCREGDKMQHPASPWIFTQPAFNRASPAPFFAHHPLLFLLLEEDGHSS